MTIATTATATTATATAAIAIAATVLSPLPPPDAETTCGPVRHGNDDLLVWAIRGDRGLDYFLGRYDRRGRPRTAPMYVGWGYDANPVCVVAAHARRIAIVFPFVDPYGGTPALTIAIVEHDRIVAKRDFLKQMCWNLEPVAIRSTRDDGWVVHYRCAEDDDAPVERIVLDADGHERS